MDLVREAYYRLTGKSCPYSTFIEYGGLRSYNGRIQLRGSILTVRLSKAWKSVDDEIVMGLVHELLIKLLKIRKHTPEMDLYHSFVRNLHRVVPKTKNDPALENSFVRVNSHFFDNLMEQPNLTWGRRSFGTLGRYEYASDTITLSTALADDLELLDYVMYHELLHKKLKFSSHAGRSKHHTTEFRRLERLFPNAEILEERLKRMLRKNRFRGWF